MDLSLAAVDPVAPVAPYLGGKRFLARTVIDRIMAVPHNSYIEPFVGMGGIFLRRPARPSLEVVNDVSRDVATLFRVLQRHYVAFMDMLRWQLTSRAEFERLKDAVPDTLTDLERAARFLYLQRTAFGGKVKGRSFGVSRDGRPARFDVTKLGPLLEAVHDRISGVVIECLPWSTILARYDSPHALFYLDPPYWGCEEDYGDGVFGRGDFMALATALEALKGSFILSLNDVPAVRELFQQFEIEEVATRYGIAGTGSRPTREVLIRRVRPL